MCKEEIKVNIDELDPDEMGAIAAEGVDEDE